jgi:hypothetical protein
LKKNLRNFGAIGLSQPLTVKNNYGKLNQPLKLKEDLQHGFLIKEINPHF